MILGWELTLFLFQIVFCISQIFYKKEEKECHMGKINRCRMSWQSTGSSPLSSAEVSWLLRSSSQALSNRPENLGLISPQKHACFRASRGNLRARWPLHAEPSEDKTKGSVRTAVLCLWCGGAHALSGNVLRRFSRPYGAPCPREGGQNLCLEGASVSSGGQPPATERPPPPNGHLFRGVFLYVPHLQGLLHHQEGALQFTPQFTPHTTPGAKHSWKDDISGKVSVKFKIFNLHTLARVLPRETL